MIGRDEERRSTVRLKAARGDLRTQLKIVRAGVCAQEWRNKRVAPVVVKHVVMLIVEQVTSNTGLVVAHSEENVAVIFGCVFIQRVAISNSHLCATVVFIEF